MDALDPSKSCLSDVIGFVPSDIDPRATLENRVTTLRFNKRSCNRHLQGGIVTFHSLGLAA
jgi:hypothetical protein